MNNIDSYIEALESYKITEDEIATEGVMLKTAGVLFLGGLAAIGVYEGYNKIKKILEGTNETSKIVGQRVYKRLFDTDHTMDVYNAVIEDIKKSKHETFYISNDNLKILETYKKDVTNKFKASVQMANPKLSKYFNMRDKFEDYELQGEIDPKRDNEVINLLNNKKKELVTIYGGDKYINWAMYKVDFVKSSSRDVELTKDELINLLTVPNLGSITSTGSNFYKYLSEKNLNGDDWWEGFSSTFEKYEEKYGEDKGFFAAPIYKYYDFLCTYNDIAEIVYTAPVKMLTGVLNVLNHISTKKS